MYDVVLDWRDIGGYFRRLSAGGMAVNHGTLLGHGTVRGAVVGYNDQAPAPEQMEAMIEMTARNLRAGALGLSSGLEYAPGSYASPEELIALCRVVSSLNGVYATHMRSEGDHLIESVRESLDVARATGVSLQISHLKVAFPANWHKIETMLSLLKEARAEGIEILADRYPYIAGSTGLSYFFPLWALQGTPRDFIKRLKNPDLAEKIRAHLRAEEKKLGSWEKVILSSVVSQKNKKWEGKTVQRAAKESNKTAYEFMRDLLIEEENRVQMVLFMAKEDNLRRILANPLVVIGADASAVSPYGVLGRGKPHPRAYGTFPRVLGKYSREERLFPLTVAIRKMTSLTARKFGLFRRGLLREGYFADVVVFNPDTVRDRATWSDPHRYPVGIRDVLVNGQPVLLNGDHTGRLPGMILKRRNEWIGK
jgi:N-acyl-D-amino-acid deacylase